MHALMQQRCDCCRSVALHRSSSLLDRQSVLQAAARQATLQGTQSAQRLQGRGRRLWLVLVALVAIPLVAVLVSRA